MSYEYIFLQSLLITLSVEVPIVFFMTRRLYKVPGSFNIILISILASALTLPYFWFIFPMFVTSRMAYMIVGESIIILIEAFIYHRLLKLKFIHALLISFVANVASVATGFL